MLQVPATAAGKKVRCRKCQSVTIVPITTITSEPDSFAQRCVNCGEEFQSTALEDLCWSCAATLELGKKQQTSDSDDSVPVVSGSSTRHRQLSEGVSSNSDTRLSKEESSPPPVQQYEDEPDWSTISKIALSVGIAGILFLMFVTIPTGGGVNLSPAPADRSSYGQAEADRPTNASAFDSLSDYTAFIKSEIGRVEKSRVILSEGNIDVQKTQSLVNPFVGTYKFIATCPMDLAGGDLVMLKFEAEVIHSRENDMWVMASGKAKQVGYRVIRGDQGALDLLFAKSDRNVLPFSSLKELAAFGNQSELVAAAKAEMADINDEIREKNIAQAIAGLRKYIESPFAANKADAENLLAECEFAISDNDAVTALLALDDVAFEQAITSGVNDGKVSHPVLQEIRYETVQRNIDSARQARKGAKGRHSIQAASEMASANFIRQQERAREQNRMRAEQERLAAQFAVLQKPIDDNQPGHNSKLFEQIIHFPENFEGKAITWRVVYNTGINREVGRGRFGFGIRFPFSTEYFTKYQGGSELYFAISDKMAERITRADIEGKQLDISFEVVRDPHRQGSYLGRIYYILIRGTPHQTIEEWIW